MARLPIPSVVLSIFPRKLILTLCVILIGSSCCRSAHAACGNSTNAVVFWNCELLQAVVDTRSAPTITARALAIVHTSMFDAWSPYDRDAIGTEPEGPGRRPSAEWTRDNKAEAASYAAYRSLLDLFPAEKALFDSAMQQRGLDPANASVDPSTAPGVGNLAAMAVLADRHHDGSNQLGDLHPGAYSDYTGYKAVNQPDQVSNPDHWQPLRIPDGKGGFVTQKYVTPQWGLVKPFALSSANELRSAEGPATHDQDRARYIRQARQIIELSASLTDRRKMIAEYWALGPGSVTPPARWFEFAEYVSARDYHTLDDDVKMFFVLGNAMLDASIACWDEKRAFDSERPITAIHYLYAGKPIRAWSGPYQGTREIDGADWVPYQEATVVTPAFPEFISGHSTFSAAGAEILRLWTGSDEFGDSYTALSGSSAIESGKTPREDITLRWRTFSEAADQAAFSRRIGGIHFEEGDLAGRTTGRIIAEKVWHRTQHFITESSEK